MRHDWMDGLRGLAIVAVVAYHAELTVRETTGPVAVLATVNAGLEPYRMPLLALLSGILLSRSLAKGPRRHLRGKVEGVLWPYLLWGVLDTTHVVLDSLVSGDDAPWSWYPDLLHDPHTSLWFLGHLFLFHVLAAPLPPAARTGLGPLLVWLSGSVDAVAADPQAHRFVLLLGWFLVGDALAREVGPRLPTPLAVRLDDLAGRLPWGPLRLVGRHSLVFYASHLIVLVYAVRLVRTAGVGDQWALMAVAVGVPLLVGALLVRLRGHRAVDALFRWPTVGSGADHARSPGRDRRGTDVWPLQMGDHEAQEGGHRRQARQAVRQADQEHRDRGATGWSRPGR